MDYDSAVTLNIGDTVARIGGLDALKALKQCFGGQRIYIPSRKALDASHPLVEALGMDLACLVCDELHRTIQYVPTLGNRWREDAVLWATRAGLRVAKIAQLADCSEAWVYEIAKTARAAGMLPKASRA
jgi:hypothetical protein